MPNSSSILTSTKKMCGIEEGYTAFDLDLILHINSVFSTLSQLGLGPLEGFAIEDSETTWTEYGEDAENLRLASIKTYVYLKVRLLFDPPTTSFSIEAMNQQAKELEWRLNIQREGVKWVAPS